MTKDVIERLERRMPATQDMDSTNMCEDMEDAIALIASQARRIAELETFYRAVAHAAGDLDQLPDSHAFEIVWASGDEDGNPAPEDPFITAGMIRRARATLKGET